MLLFLKTLHLMVCLVWMKQIVTFLSARQNSWKMGKNTLFSWWIFSGLLKKPVNFSSLLLNFQLILPEVGNYLMKKTKTKKSRVTVCLNHMSLFLALKLLGLCNFKGPKRARWRPSLFWAFKGTVAWNFWTLVFCINRQYLGPWAIS